VGLVELLFLSQQDGEDAPRLLRIAWVRQAVLEREVVTSIFQNSLTPSRSKAPKSCSPYGSSSGVKSEKSRNTFPR